MCAPRTYRTLDVASRQRSLPAGLHQQAQLAKLDQWASKASREKAMNSTRTEPQQASDGRNDEYTGVEIRLLRAKLAAQMLEEQSGLSLLSPRRWNTVAGDAFSPPSWTLSADNGDTLRLEFASTVSCKLSRAIIHSPEASQWSPPKHKLSEAQLTACNETLADAEAHSAKQVVLLCHDALNALHQKFERGEVSAWDHGKTRENLIGQMLIATAQACGIELRHTGTLWMTSQAEYEITVDPVTSAYRNSRGAPCGHFGQAFADLLSTVPTRTGIEAGQNKVLAENGWTRIFHFDAERMVTQFAENIRQEQAQALQDHAFGDAHDQSTQRQVLSPRP